MHPRFPALALLLALGTPNAYPASAALQVSAVVAPRVVATVQGAPALVVIGQGDVDRGYIDVATPVVIQVRSNMPHAFALEFRSVSDAVTHIEADARSASGALPATGMGLLVPPRSSGQSLTVRLRFFLGPQTIPGTYPWPLRLASSA